jgi:hypothetical protein
MTENLERTDHSVRKPLIHRVNGAHISYIPNETSHNPRHGGGLHVEIWPLFLDDTVKERSCGNPNRQTADPKGLFDRVATIKRRH